MSSEVAETEDLSRLTEALRSAIERCATLIEHAPSASALLPGSEWTVRDLAAHLALGSEIYHEYATGRTEPVVDVSDVAGGSLARTNAELLAGEPERDLQALVSRLRAGAETLLTLVAASRGDEPVTWNGIELDLRSMLGFALGEYLMHGYDLARMLGRAWPIAPDDARSVLASALPLLPLLADPRTTAGVHAAFDLRVRGGKRISLVIDDGRVTTGAPGARVDCHVSADPVALLCVAYGRRSQWIPALTGRLFAWGRKPWLGLRLTNYLVAP